MTSIEWLIEEMLSKGFFKESVTLTNIDHLQYKAEEMHKQELGKTWDTALDKYEVRAGNYMRAYEDFDDYYQETFVSKGSDDAESKNYYYWTDENGTYGKIITKTVKLIKMVEKLADEQYKNENISSELKGILISAQKKGFIDGYNKAKETLYIEEQVREAIRMARREIGYGSNYEFREDVIILSLKRKKD